MESSVASILASIALIQFLGWMTPGANLVAVSSASMAQGRAMGVATAAGIAVGVGLWAALAVFGIAFVFEATPWLFIGLKLAGAAFLCWLGWKSIRAALDGRATSLKGDGGPGEILRAFQRGFLVLMTNPKAPIFFGAVLTSFLPFGAPAWVMAAIVVEFLILGFILNSFTALVFSTRHVMGWFDRNQRTIGIAVGALYAALGLLVIWDAVGG